MVITSEIADCKRQRLRGAAVFTGCYNCQQGGERYTLQHGENLCKPVEDSEGFTVSVYLGPCIQRLNTEACEQTAENQQMSS